MDHGERFYRLGHRWRGIGEIVLLFVSAGKASSTGH